MIFRLAFYISWGCVAVLCLAFATPAGKYSVSHIRPVVDTLPRDQVMAAVACGADQNISYSLYLPPAPGKSCPVVILFDPHGNGLLPVNLYRIVAKQFGFALVGSNNSRNGNDWQQTQQIFDRLLEDITHRLPVDAGRIIVCGFSGGGKVASFLALTSQRVFAAVAMGAALPDLAASNPQKPLVMVVGRDDMNLTDMLAISGPLQQASSHTALLLFQGKHEWAPADIFESALAFLESESWRSRRSMLNETALRISLLSLQQRMRSAEQRNDLLAVEREGVFAAAMLTGISQKADSFRRVASEIGLRQDYRRQSNSWQEQLRAERAIKDEFARHFQVGDEAYWLNKIPATKRNAALQTAAGEMNRRLLAYLSLAFYSISNQMIRDGRYVQAEFFVDQYKSVDPQNSEAWYFSALVNARRNQKTRTEADLSRAIEFGLRDISRVRGEPLFQHLGIDFSQMEQLIRNYSGSHSAKTNKP